MGVNIIGLTLDDKVPGFYRQTSYGAGGGSFDTAAKKLFIAGTMIVAGSATPDGSVYLVTSVEEADALFGAGSELACMCYAIFGLAGLVGGVQGVEVYAAP